MTLFFRSDTVKDSDDNMKFSDGDKKLTYRPRKLYYLDKGMSEVDPETTYVTVPNIPYWTGLNQANKRGGSCSRQLQPRKPPIRRPSENADLAFEGRALSTLIVDGCVVSAPGPPQRPSMPEFFAFRGSGPGRL